MPLLPYDYLHLVNCPEVVTISDILCTLQFFSSFSGAGMVGVSSVSTGGAPRGESFTPVGHLCCHVNMHARVQRFPRRSRNLFIPSRHSVDSSPEVNGISRILIHLIYIYFLIHQWFRCSRIVKEIVAFYLMYLTTTNSSLPQ